MGTEPTAFDLEELLSHRGWVRRVAVQLVGEAQGEDLAQDTLVAALEQRPDSRRDGLGLKAWLRSVTHRLALHRRRGDARRLGREATVARPDMKAPEHLGVERAESIELLVREVLGLSEADRRVVLLRSFDRLSFDEIAARVDSSPGAVRRRHGRALEKLRVRLEERYGGREAWLSAILPWTHGEQGLAPTLAAPATSTHGSWTLNMTHPLTWIAAATVALVSTLAWIDSDAAPAVAPSGPGESRTQGARLAVLESSGSRTQPDLPTAGAAGGLDGAMPKTVQEPTKGVRVQVVSKLTGELCPGALVRYLPLDATDPAEIAASMKSTTDMRTPMERFGLSFTADEQGLVTIPVEVGYASVSGEWEDLYEFAYVPAETQGVYKLELRTVRTIDVRVLDWRGNTVEGMPVELATPASGARGRLWAGTTDEAGIALIDDLDVALSRSKDDESLELFAHVPAQEPVVLELDRERLDQAYTLQLGRTGSLEVQLVGADGEPYSEGAELVATALSTATASNPDADRLRKRVTSSAPFEDGRATLPHVAVGTRFEILVIPELGSGTRRWEIEGPTQADETRSIHLAYDVPTTRYRVALVDGRGAPLANRGVKVRSIRYTATSYWLDHGSAETDSGGHLVFQVTRKAIPGIVRRELEFEVLPSTEADTAVVASRGRGMAIQTLPLDTGAESMDAPNLTVEPWPLLVAGQVVDANGQPVPRAIVQVSALVPKAGPPHAGTQPGSAYTPQFELQARCDDQGRFRLEGRCLWNRLRVEARVDGGPSEPGHVTPVEFEAGASDLVLRKTD